MGFNKGAVNVLMRPRAKRHHRITLSFTVSAWAPSFSVFAEKRIESHEERVMTYKIDASSKYSDDNNYSYKMR